MNNNDNNNNNNHQVDGNQQLATHRLSVVAVSIESESTTLMPINVKSMLLNGVSDKEVARNWLASIKCEEYLANFLDNGYDMHILTRMTPQDLTAIGCKLPATRKKLLIEIKKLNIEDDIPDYRPDSFEKWLHLMKLIEYYPRLCAEGYDTIDKVCDLTWEDLEEIGITKLGHQKRLLVGIDKLKKLQKRQEEIQNEQQSIYDVHPNHRVTLNKNSQESRMSTLSRSTSRSGFFQTRSGANLDHRGLPVATVMPALKHINAQATSDVKTDKFNINGDDNQTSQQTNIANHRLSTSTTYGTYQQALNRSQDNPRSSINDFCTMKRTPPPLPPMRTNSLKMPTTNGLNNNNNSIYGNAGNVGSFAPTTQSNSSMSFLRSPKLSTMTNNKFSSTNGQGRSIGGTQTLMRSVMPVREAPAPPSLASSPGLPGKIDEEPSMQMHIFASPIENINNQTLMNTSLISHQLAGADEFPPPPPST